MAREPEYLEGEARVRFDAWLEATRKRHDALRFSELRKGVQALSALYVERRSEGSLAQRSLDGAGKRAAFASYFSALHFLAAHHAAEALCAAQRWSGQRAVADWGCGAGASGSALALALGGVPVRAFDRSAFCLAEARHTYRAFGLRAQTRRVDVAETRSRDDELVVLGWVVNELEEGQRSRLLEKLSTHLRGRRQDGDPSGGALLMLEPLARPASPFWDEWCESLAACGAESGTFKQRVRLPAWLREMDRAARLDHKILGARWLAAPALPTIGAEPTGAGN